MSRQTTRQMLCTRRVSCVQFTRTVRARHSMTLDGDETRCTLKAASVLRCTRPEERIQVSRFDDGTSMIQFHSERMGFDEDDTWTGIPSDALILDTEPQAVHA